MMITAATAAAIGTFAVQAATVAAITFAVAELTKPDIPGAEAPPGITDEEAREAESKERRRRALAISRASTILTPRGTLGEPLPSLQQKQLLGA